MSICPCFWLKLLFLKDTEWIDSCESHVQFESLNLSHEQFDRTKSENYCTKCKYFVQQCLCTILECIEVAQLPCIGTYFMLFCMFWCYLYLAHVLSILCPVIWCPCPEMITHYRCNVLDASRCPGHVQQAVSLKLFWTCSRRTFATKTRKPSHRRGVHHIDRRPIILSRQWLWFRRHRGCR